MGKFFLVGLTFLMSALLAVVLWGLEQIPSTTYIRGCFTTKMYQVDLCPGGPNYVPLKNISSVLQKTLILAEDSTFYQHQGFDWESIEKSAKENLKKGQYKRGGSTITQQLAKNLFLTKEKTLLRKVLEAVMTLKLEKSLNKKEILERYFNVVEFGKNIYGIKAASKFYFKKSPAELDAAESAFLIMLLPNPVKYSVSFQKKELTRFARKRVQSLIENLYQYQRISLSEHDIALAKVDSLFLDFGQNSANAAPQGSDPGSSESSGDDDSIEDDFL